VYTGVGKTAPLQSRFRLEAEPEPARRDIAMDVGKILAELKAEREQVEQAIISLERLVRGRVRGPGRPPNWMSDTMPKRRGRPPGSKNKVAGPAKSSAAVAGR
jgi:hypothetical protein